jgi:phage N-6-adenine-methyltransferase
MMTSALVTSNTDVWSTPQPFFNALNDEFGFTLDVCAIPENAKCDRFITPSEDALKQRWHGVCWMNPPYGRTIHRWIKKAFEESRRGSTVVCLLPARTDTRWWHDYVMQGEVRFIRGRLKFGGSKENAPFPSAVVIFRPESQGLCVTCEQDVWPDHGINWGGILFCSAECRDKWEEEDNG